LLGPILFLIFMVPLPGWVLDIVTIPLKIHVSDFVVALLYKAGLPIAQNGVILMIGPYELLVADACAGMNSIFSLSAISLFYISQVPNRSLWHKLVLIACVMPISFIANVVRVIALVLLTYYFGDAAGRGLSHESTGILLFSVALASIFILDFAGLGLVKGLRRLRHGRTAA
jgi:exosortase